MVIYTGLIKKIKYKKQYNGEDKRIIQSLAEKARDMLIWDNPITQLQINILWEYPDKSLISWTSVYTP